MQGTPATQPYNTCICKFNSFQMERSCSNQYSKKFVTVTEQTTLKATSYNGLMASCFHPDHTPAILLNLTETIPRV